MRTKRRYRAGPGALVGLGAALLIGCGGGPSSDGGADGGGGGDMAMMAGGDMAMMAGGDMAMMGGGLVVSPSTMGGDYRNPTDAVPSPDGTSFYFLARNKDGNGAVFKVAAGGGMAQELSGADPGFVAPLAIAISSDGNTLFVGDPAYNDAMADGRGALFSLPAGGGKPTLLAGVSGYRPRGLDVIKVTGAPSDEIFFTGVDPADGSPGLFKAKLDGTGVTAVAKGGDFLDPSGVAVAMNGDAYVTDAVGQGSSRVIKVSGGKGALFVGGLEVGYPAGAALSLDEKLLFVSGNDPATGTSLVWAIELATKKVSSANNGIGQNLDSGGLHRARQSGVMSWCGVTAGGGGGGIVFRVEFK